MSIRTGIHTLLVAGRLLLVAALATGLVPVPASAQDAKPESNTTQQTAPPPQVKPKRERLSKSDAARARKAPDPATVRRAQQELIETVAAKLGISPERLNAAIKDARIDLANKAVVEGRLSREQADRVIEQLNRGQDPAGASPDAADAVKPDSRDASPHAVDPVTDIDVSFKLDPRLTRGLYMGDRWISPPRYMAVQDGNELTVEARAEARAHAHAVNIEPQWTASEPDMVTTSPSQGRHVKITVRRVGQSTLTVATPGFSREFSIKATTTNDGRSLQVEISRDPVKAPAGPRAAISRD
jgi:hypothetical protein